MNRADYLALGDKQYELRHTVDMFWEIQQAIYELYLHEKTCGRPCNCPPSEPTS